MLTQCHELRTPNDNIYNYERKEFYTLITYISTLVLAKIHHTNTNSYSHNMCKRPFCPLSLSLSLFHNTSKHFIIIHFVLIMQTCKATKAEQKKITKNLLQTVETMKKQQQKTNKIKGKFKYLTQIGVISFV